ncbi:MAG: WD40 repeat domain-containing protein [Cyanobacteria bacterium J06626_18]
MSGASIFCTTYGSGIIPKLCCASESYGRQVCRSLLIAVDIHPVSVTQSLTHHPKVELSTHQIVLKPGDGPDLAREGAIASPDLTVTVTNTTPHFISFHLELEAATHDTHRNVTWYRVEPNVGAKKPPGDRTHFHVSLLRAPVPIYDTTIPLQVKILSAELASLAATATVYLKILRPTKTLRVFFPFQDLSVYPGARLKIPVLVYNLNPQLREVTLRLEGIDAEWFPEGIEQTVWVDAGGSLEVAFGCSPPAIPSTLHKLHRLSVQATDVQGNSASAGGHFQILPWGRLHSQIDEPEKTIPDQLTALSTVKGSGVSYDWTFANDSNVAQTIHLTANAEKPVPGAQWFADPLTLDPATAGQASLQVQARRPWLGWTRTHFIAAMPTLHYPDSEEPLAEITVTPASQLLTLQVKPRIPLILQVLAAIIGGLALWGLAFMSPQPLHKGPVNTVRLLETGNQVFSGSSDKTLRQWQVNRTRWLPDVRRLRPHTGRQPVHTFDKAIRVAAVIPSGLKQVAVGLENGEIELWDVDPPRPVATLLDEDQFDRVFALAFSDDSRYLFSGHGSGTVRVWERQAGQWQTQPAKKLYWGLPKDLSFTIASLAVSSDDELLAIAGQFNRLTLWDWRSLYGAIAYDIPYTYLAPASASDPAAPATGIAPVTSAHSSLTHIEFASANPDIMVTADNVGFITVWDLQRLRSCMPAATPNPRASEGRHGNRLKVIRPVDCPPEATILAQWQAGQQGSAIREVALDETGCFLASTGDDGQIDVWPLTTDGTLTDPAQPVQIAIDAFPNNPLNSVDIHRTRDNVLLIAADTPGHRVQLYRHQSSNYGCQ